MTTLISDANSTSEQRERLFFLVMALAIAATVVIAFSLFIVTGISRFASPWWVHVHALTFMGWIAIYIAQNTLAYRADIALHRRLGEIAVGYAVWMVLVGLVLTPVTLAVGRSPPFFAPPYFLALDWTNIILFGGLLYAGFAMRRRTDWHRRLMLCATVCVMAPATGRLIVLSTIPMTAPLNAATLAPFMFAGMVFDWRNRGRVHPAWFWGLATLVVFAGVTEVLANFQPFAALANRIAG